MSTTFEPIRRQSVAAGVFEQLSAQVLDGRLRPGEALPAERTLTESFGVNRQAIREALQRLHQLGLVEIRHGGATRVRDYRREAGLDLLPRLLVQTPALIRSAMEMRAAIGTDAAALCARRGQPDRLTAVAAEMAVTQDLATLTRLDLEFWDLVVDGSDNVAYRLALNSLRQSYAPVETVVSEIVSAELRDAEGHRAIADAVLAGDAEAASRAAAALLAKGTAAVMELLA